MTTKYQEIGCYEMRVATIGEEPYFVYCPYLTKIDFDSPEVIAASIDNLSRNKLINPQDFHYSDDKLYACIRDTQSYKSLIEKFLHSPDNQELRPYKMSIKSTSFGKAFYSVCATSL